MKIWTYAEARNKILKDQDLQDQVFVEPAELIEYFNEGIEEAESEILKIDEDYFLARYPLPLVQGTAAYAYPYDIYGYKVRGLVYSNGSTIYNARRFPRKDKLDLIALAAQYAASEDYRWYHTNVTGQGGRIVLVPPARETAVVPPNSNTSTPLVLWYIRKANRIPILGEYIHQYEKIVQNATNVVTSGGSSGKFGFDASKFVTGDAVRLSSSGTMPGNFTAGTTYYVYISGSNYVTLCSSRANAIAGSPITPSSTGSGILTISIAATQTLIDATEIDIPEFTKFVIQWAKCRCLEKESDPRLDGAAKTLEQQRMQMVSTLTEAQQDDQTEITPDLSAYSEMS